MAHILVIDDSPTIRSMVTTILKENGHEIREAENGAQALKILEDFRPDVCVCDVEMPEMDGYSLLRKVRAQEALKELPFLILTAKGKLGDMFHLEGATDFVEKSPEAFQTVQKKIESLLG
jgi:two-component system OmpR family response regulator